MEDLVFRRKYPKSDEFIGEFTDVCDNCTIFSEERKQRLKEHKFVTYILEDDNNITPNIFAIRHPGATRGHIKTDDNRIITEIVIYKSSGLYKKEPHNVGIYKDEILSAVQQFIGRKLVIEK